MTDGITLLAILAGCLLVGSVVIALVDSRAAQIRQLAARADTERRVRAAREHRCPSCGAGDVTQFRCGYCAIPICAGCAVDGCLCRTCARGAA